MSLPGKEAARNEQEARSFRDNLLSDLRMSSEKVRSEGLGEDETVKRFRKAITIAVNQFLVNNVRETLVVDAPNYKSDMEHPEKLFNLWLESNPTFKEHREFIILHSSLKALDKAITEAAKDLTASNSAEEFKVKNKTWSERIAICVMKAVGCILGLFGKVSKSDPLEIFVDKIHIPAEQFFNLSKSFIKVAEQEKPMAQVKSQEQEVAQARLDNAISKGKARVPNRRAPTRGHKTPGVLESESSVVKGPIDEVESKEKAQSATVEVVQKPAEKPKSYGAKVSTAPGVMTDLKSALAARGNKDKQKGS